MKRVAILSGVFPDMRCGVALHTWRVARTLARRGEWDVHVVTSAVPEVDAGRADGFALHAVVRRWGLTSLGSIVREIERVGPDILHVQTPTAAYGGRANLTIPLLWLGLGSLRRRLRLVVTQHDLAVGHRLMQRKHGMLLKRADAITVSNDRDHQAVARLSPRLLGRTHVAPLASNIDIPALTGAEREAARRELGASEGELLLAYFGFVVPTRNLKTLVRALALLRSDGLPSKLVVVGGPARGAEAYLASCRALAASLGVARDVTWTGYAPEALVGRALAASDLLVAPMARGADFRNASLLAASQAGLPILTTENPRYGVDRELRASGACRFFDPDGPRSLAEAVKEVGRDGAAAARMKDACRRVAARHTWEEHVRVLERAYAGEPPEPYDPEAAAHGGAA